MKVKLSTLFDAHPAIELLAKQFFAVSEIGKVRDLIDDVNGHYAEIAQKQEELLALYAKQTETGDYEMDDDKKGFYEMELTQFLEKEVDIRWEPMPIENLGEKVRMPIQGYNLLQFLFTEAEQPAETVV